MYDSKQPTKDEKQIKEFMIAKYEKKMYYSDPVSQKLNNGIQTKPTVTTATTTYQVNICSYSFNVIYFMLKIYLFNIIKYLHSWIKYAYILLIYVY